MTQKMKRQASLVQHIVWQLGTTLFQHILNIINWYDKKLHRAQGDKNQHFTWCVGKSETPNLMCLVLKNVESVYNM